MLNVAVAVAGSTLVFGLIHLEVVVLEEWVGVVNNLGAANEFVKGFGFGVCQNLTVHFDIETFIIRNIRVTVRLISFALAVTHRALA